MSCSKIKIIQGHWWLGRYSSSGRK